MKFFRKIITAVATMAMLGAVVGAPVMAEGESSNSACSREFLGLVSWHCGVDLEPSDESGLTDMVVGIAFNILMDATMIAGYLALGYIIYGGYKYMFSYGDAGKVATGKKTLSSAIIGLAIVMLSSVIFGTIKSVLMRGVNGTETVEEMNLINANANRILLSTIQWAISVAGVVAAVFVVYGGITYMTSSGDAGKLTKAKNVITYSLIGLAIVALSQVILGFVRDGIDNARRNEVSLAENVMIGKGGQ